MIFIIFWRRFKNILLLKTYMADNFKSLFFISYEENVQKKYFKKNDKYYNKRQKHPLYLRSNKRQIYPLLKKEIY